MKRYFITGIDTNVGKTFVSAVLAQTLGADYWKPVQCGVADGTDVNEVRNLVTNTKCTFFPEAYSFAAPVSPHLAAAIEGRSISLSSFKLPETKNNLIIEGAGGMLVPLNDKDHVIKLANIFNAEVILVIRNYLGCINHSLLSIEYLLRNKYAIKGVILNGDFDPMVKQTITGYSDIPVLAEFTEMGKVNKEIISEVSNKVKKEIFL